MIRLTAIRRPRLPPRIHDLTATLPSADFPLESQNFRNRTDIPLFQRARLAIADGMQAKQHVKNLCCAQNGLINVTSRKFGTHSEVNPSWLIAPCVGIFQRDGLGDHSRVGFEWKFEDHRNISVDERQSAVNANGFEQDFAHRRTARDREFLETFPTAHKNQSSSTK